MQRPVPKIAIIGCGAVTERYHLPALAARGLAPQLLVDLNVERARQLGRTFNAATASDDYRGRLGEFDAAIVASPHFLHASTCTELLRAGIHVLVEKPMALTKADCDVMIAAAEEGKAVLAVGLLRRFMHVANWVKAALTSELLGPIESFDFREGSVYSWPVTSGFFFRKETAGGGVLMDTGAHTLDLLHWWLGDIASVEYWDDSYGGVEADCKLELTLASGARGIVELSRTRALRTTAILRGSRGQLEVGLNKNELTASSPALLEFKHRGRDGTQMPAQVAAELFSLQLENWLKAIDGQERAWVPGQEGARSVASIERCYERRRLWELPWVRSSHVDMDATEVRTA